MGDMLIEPHRLDVTSRRMVLRESQSRQTITMAQVSDLHIQAFGWHEQRVASAANEAGPDFIVITGDAVDDRRRLHALDEFMRALDAGIPKFAIPGNWEHWSGIDLAALGKLYERHNCRLVINASAHVEMRGKRIRLVCLDDLVGGQPDIGRAFAGGPDADGDLILAHCPAHRDIIRDNRSLMVSGHTHGGQIALPGFAPFVPPGSAEYLRGSYETANGPLYVSRGLGTSMVNMRFNSVPELALFQLVV